MRCKVGDLAVVVNSTSGNEGRIVTCIRFSKAVMIMYPDGQSRPIDGWLIEPALPGCLRGICAVMMDEQLRPIRDPGPDAVDETIQRLGTPLMPKEFERAIDEFIKQYNEKLEKELTR